MKISLRRSLTLCLLLGFLLLTADLFAQGKGYKRSGRFKAGAMLGLNMAQVDGDNYSGYHRPGMQGGLMGVVVLNRNNILSAELLFSQRGSRPSNDEYRDRVDYRLRIRLNYVEVPLVFHHLMNEREDRSFSSDYHFGLSFGRLVSSRIEESSYHPFNSVRSKDSLFREKDNIRSNDLSLILGYTVYFNRYLGLTLRSCFSLTPFYQQPQFSAMRAYHLTLAAGYYLH